MNAVLPLLAVAFATGCAAFGFAWWKTRRQVDDLVRRLGEAELGRRQATEKMNALQQRMEGAVPTHTGESMAQRREALERALGAGDGDGHGFPWLETLPAQPDAADDSGFPRTQPSLDVDLATPAH